MPGEKASISCPHNYPLFYEPLGLDSGQRFLEVGLGSGYGTTLAREIVGKEGLVVSVEIDPATYEFARENLKKAGYTDIVLVNGDGGSGYLEMSPYDRVCVTAACMNIPPSLIEELSDGGRLIIPLIEGEVQKLTLLEKRGKEVIRRVICKVLYINLRGRYGIE